MKLALHSLDKFRDFGLLLMRAGLGITFIILHGGPKLMGGTEQWAEVGGAMTLVGIDFAPAFWGFLAAFAESVGALLLVIGFLARPALVLLTITMVFATCTHLFLMEDGWGVASHPLKLAFVFLGLFFVGPGRYSVDQMLK